MALTGMPSLSAAEKFELGAIPVAVAATAWLAPRPALGTEWGELIAGAALVILVQGFFRDLWLLRQARRQAAGPAREARCMCVESALGLTGVVAGVGLVGLGFDPPVSLNPAGFAGVVGVTMLVGYALKDFVFAWSPWKIYREKDHAQVILRWRK